MAHPRDYQEAVDYIEALPRFTRKHSLAHTREFLKRLGEPGLDQKIVHVAGTNGKGSVCACLQAVLEAEEKRCGFFTSPHLIRINERIQIDRSPIDDDRFYQVFRRTLEAAESMEEEGLEHPSYFEFLFGMGMTAFAQAKTEYIILETGLGGRLDATNAPEHPALTVITSISLDHTDILGETIEEIAAEKAGIIKPGVPVIFDGGNRQAAEVIREKAREKGAFCREISKNAFEILEVHRNDIAFSRRNAYDRDVTWHVPLCGVYQVMNTEMALQAAEYLLRGERIRKDRWIRAVADVKWEGRMEQAAPHLTLDGAHNPGAVEAFVQNVRRLWGETSGERRPVLVFAAAADKRYEEMVRCLCEKLDAKVYIATEFDDGRAVPAEELGRLFEKYTREKVLWRRTPKEALQAAFSLRGEGEVYCVGSLYLVGAVKKHLAGGAEHA
ncbi:MAG TPA: bifunctional folylpolyglutamate synthase/dihydrofolate synthase [Candidatus Dorea gallistercoris]|uniref:tetrahydrofolate synthase n=1 Tax=Candidatus Dorea gallistercoris TaxID=2838542 RepID=A0A9D1RCQ5_9FIRM|nr:bifunctional folylpolyglutamate synthase/dihydrofolate synthase [Candidatus Dorea gallistercoris]